MLKTYNDFRPITIEVANYLLYYEGIVLMLNKNEMDFIEDPIMLYRIADQAITV